MSLAISLHYIATVKVFSQTRQGAFITLVTEMGIAITAKCNQALVDEVIKLIISSNAIFKYWNKTIIFDAMANLS
ncbi:hypothetical protein [Pedobacter sp.]|uniref:hypothetical protein n=1 Tax=Pedobacter sp. TaxID=1411316 RepID=UPI0031D9E825